MTEIERYCKANTTDPEQLKNWMDYFKELAAEHPETCLRCITDAASLENSRLRINETPSRISALQGWPPKTKHQSLEVKHERKKRPRQDPRRMAQGTRSNQPATRHNPTAAT